MTNKKVLILARIDWFVLDLPLELFNSYLSQEGEIGTFFRQPAFHQILIYIIYLYIVRALFYNTLS